MLCARRRERVGKQEGGATERREGDLVPGREGAELEEGGVGGGGGWEGEEGRERGGAEGVGYALVSGNQYLLRAWGEGRGRGCGFGGGWRKRMEGSGTVRRPRLMVPTNLEMIIVGRDIVLVVE